MTSDFRLYFFSFLLFLLPSTAITTPIGVGVVELTVLLSALYYAKSLWTHKPNVFQPARWIAAAFAFNLLTATFSVIWFDLKPSEAGGPLQQLIAVSSIGLIALANPRKEWFWHGLFVGAIGAGCFALYQRFGLRWERAGGFHQIIMFGDLSMAMGLMSLAAIRTFSRTRLAALPYIAFLAGLTASLLSGSRGGWIAIILVLIPLYWYGPHAARLMTVRRALLMAAGCAIAGFVLFSFKLQVTNRLDAVSHDIQQFEKGNPMTSVGERLEMWRAAWIMFSDHPLIGVGKVNFGPALNELKKSGDVHPGIGNFGYAHNEMINALATGGLLGALALLMLYGAPFLYFVRVLRRQDDAQPFALAGVLLVSAFAISGLTQVLFSHHIGASFYALMVCFLAGLCVPTSPATAVTPS